MHYPELFVYPSLRGGLGVYTVGPLAKNVYITEYGGRVVSREHTQLLKKEGQHTHSGTSSFRTPTLVAEGGAH